MNISCDCSIEYDGTNEFYNDRVVKARKEHFCCECGSIIKKGERYEYVSGKSEGDFWIVKTCIPCKSIRERYCPNGWIFGSLQKAIFNCLEFDYIKGE